MIPTVQHNLKPHSKESKIIKKCFFFQIHTLIEMDGLTESSKIDFPNLITLALEKSLPWDSLCIIFDNVTLTQNQSKSVIKILLKELQKLQENPNDPTENLQEESLTDEIAGATKEENVSDEVASQFQEILEQTVEELADNEFINSEEEDAKDENLSNEHENEFKEVFEETVKNLNIIPQT